MAKLTVEVPDFPGWKAQEAVVLPFDVPAGETAKDCSVTTRIRVCYARDGGAWEPAADLHVARLIGLGHLARARFRNFDEIDWREGRLLGFEYTQHGQRFWISEFGRFQVCEVWRT